MDKGEGYAQGNPGVRYLVLRHRGHAAGGVPAAAGAGRADAVCHAGGKGRMAQPAGDAGAAPVLVHKLSAVFAIVPLFGWMLRWGVDQVVDLLLLLGMALFAIRAADRMHKGLDSDIPFAASFVNRLF